MGPCGIRDTPFKLKLSEMRENKHLTKLDRFSSKKNINFERFRFWR